MPGMKNDEKRTQVLRKIFFKAAKSILLKKKKIVLIYQQLTTNIIYPIKKHANIITMTDYVGNISKMIKRTSSFGCA